MSLPLSAPLVSLTLPFFVQNIVEGLADQCRPKTYNKPNTATGRGIVRETEGKTSSALTPTPELLPDILNPGSYSTLCCLHSVAGCQPPL